MYCSPRWLYRATTRFARLVKLVTMKPIRGKARPDPPTIASILAGAPLPNLVRDRDRLSWLRRAPVEMIVPRHRWRRLGYWRWCKSTAMKE
jgi:hypothetical protein